MSADFIEERHELKVARRVVDVRPVSEKFAEWLSDKFNLVALCVPLLLMMLAFPAFALVPGALAFAVLLIHRNTNVVMPLRYPAINEEPDPATGKRGDGILFYGNVRSRSPFEAFKEVWGSDDSARKHKLIIGSTGSGKSETLKGIFFNALAWGSGFFIADGKADNKLPTDSMGLVRSVGRDDDMLFLNFLLGGRTPEQVRRSKRRRTNKINPFSSADADTIIQMGANMLPKVEGEGKNWQEKALNLWRAVVVALCYKRDNEGFNLSVTTLIEYMPLPKIEELYIEGYEEAQERGGEWSYGYVGIKSYLDSGCPAYKVDKLLNKNGYGDTPLAPQGYGGARPQASGKAFEQDSMAYEQHAYRTSQLMPVLNLLDKTYGFIFRDKFPEIDMVDVALNDRILCMLIPSLEKSSQEAENLGKLAIAALRVMMGRNLGSEIEGSRAALLDSKATNANYPYIVALDELAYYFADGIAVMFAQARSLGMSMIAAAQDLEKLTEGNRASEAGAMLANQVTKIFMRIDDAKKTYEMISTILGKVTVAVKDAMELGGLGWRYKGGEVRLQEVERAPLGELQGLKAGQALINAEGRTNRISTFYVGEDLKKYATDQFYVLRFLQVRAPVHEEMEALSVPMNAASDTVEKGRHLLAMLRHQRARSGQPPLPDPIIDAVATMAGRLGGNVTPQERAVALYQAAAAIARAKLSSALATEQVEDEAAVAGAASPGDRVAADVAVGGDASVAQMRQSQAALSDPLSFLDYDAPLARKPADEILSSDGDALAVESAAQSRVLDPVQSLIGSGRFVTVFAQEESELSPAEQLAQGLVADSQESRLTPAQQSDASWVIDAVAGAKAVAQRDVARQSALGPTSVGFSAKTMESVVQIEDLLGSPNPQLSAKKMEAVVSAGVTPQTTPEAPLDDSELAKLFEGFKERT